MLIVEVHPGQVLELLKASFTSTNVLNEVFGKYCADAKGPSKFWSLGLSFMMNKLKAAFNSKLSRILCLVHQEITSTTELQNNRQSAHTGHSVRKFSPSPGQEELPCKLWKPASYATEMGGAYEDSAILIF